jgi:hypothetical protein
MAFGYDSLSRLAVASGPWGAGGYTYDPEGNRLTQNIAGLTTYTYVPGTNRLATAVGAEPAMLSHDAGGNMTGDGAHTYVYNQNQRLIQVKAGVTPVGPGRGVRQDHRGAHNRIRRQGRGSLGSSHRKRHRFHPTCASAQNEPLEHLFTAALTHDIGKVVLGSFPEIDAYGIIALALRDRISFEEAERTILGIDHAEVGAFLAEHWGLPGSIVDAVRLHHQPELSLEHPLIVNLVHVADVVCLIVYDVLNELLKVRTLFKFRDEGCPQERPRGPFRSASRLPSFPFRPPNLYDVRALRGNLKAAGLQPVLTTFVQDANLPAARTPLSPDRTDYPADVPRIFC